MNLTSNKSYRIIPTGNSSTALAAYEDIPTVISAAAGSIGIVLLVVNAIANGLLFKFVLAEQRAGSRRKTTAKTFVLGITIFSLLSVFGKLLLQHKFQMLGRHLKVLP